MPWLDWRAPTRKSLPFLFRSSEGAPRSRHLAGLSCSSFCAQVVGDFDPVARSCKKKAIVDALGLESGATRKGTTSFLFFQGRRCRRQQRENDAGRGGSDEGSLGLLSFLSFPAPSSSSFPLSPLPLTAAPLLLSLISYLSFPLPLSPQSFKNNTGPRKGRRHLLQRAPALCVRRRPPPAHQRRRRRRRPGDPRGPLVAPQDHRRHQRRLHRRARRREHPSGLLPRYLRVQLGPARHAARRPRQGHARPRRRAGPLLARRRPPGRQARSRSRRSCGAS